VRTRPHPRGRQRSLGWRVAATLLSTGLLATFLHTPRSGGSGPLEAAIVRAAPGQLDAAKRQVTRTGGQVGEDLALIGGFVARVPAGDFAALSATDAIATVTRDLRLTPLQNAVAPGMPAADPTQDTGSLAAITRLTGAQDLWACGWTGQGIDVALIDSGIAPVPGIGPVVNAVDLSFDAQDGDEPFIDGFGHGTHLASLVNGQDQPLAVPDQQCRFPKLARSKQQLDPSYAAKGPDARQADATAPSVPWNDGSQFTGIAPGARLVDVKVGAADGSVDVSQVIAALDWIVTYGRRDGLNVRVINLSYGTDSDQSWELDPLSYAAQIAIDNGFLVVAAAGNDGSAAMDLADPAMNPNVLAVGAVDYHRSFDPSDWSVADFANHGSSKRSPDVAFPGVSVLGLRVDGSFAATFFPGGLVGDRYIRGSGTSQAAALASGMAALLLSMKPDLHPADLKATMMGSSRKVGGRAAFQGAGVLTAGQLALGAGDLLSTAPAGKDSTVPAKVWGSGSIAAARGTSAAVDPAAATEVDAFGTSFDAGAWAKAAKDRKAWSHGQWMGQTIAGFDEKAKRWTTAKWSTTGTGSTAPADGTDTFERGRWTGSHGSGGNWNGDSWQGSRWSGSRWSGSRWSGSRWSDVDWSGSRWSGSRWSGSRWSGSRWSGTRWSGSNWSSAGWR
jgi:serine protease AprX